MHFGDLDIKGFIAKDRSSPLRQVEEKVDPGGKV